MTFNFEDKVKELVKKTKRGDYTAPYKLGKLYLEIEEHKNEKTALKWFKKAAKMSCTPAYYEIAKLYQNGQGLKVNRKKAFTNMYLAGKDFEIKAFYELYLMYKEGKGTKKDQDAAFLWLYRAAETGENRAYFPLAQALCASLEDKSEAQKEEALKWMEKASQAGSTEAAQFLAKNEQIESPK
ncbi:MAG: sel1 repeat family protein [Deltaproteobacteria bacterium]|jgi:TPR repeat protein|nr:sel1 repeat family protein [Deltaproteobacteria bacterium]